MQYLIRLDDITPYMDRRKFEAVREVLDRYGIKPVIGVVPLCRDKTICADEDACYSEEEFRALTKELADNGWTVAQHGTYHVYETEDSGLLGINDFSEYAGLSYEAQYEKLKAGREELSKQKLGSDLFMAPGHSFDRNTVKALRALGFTAITDGLYKRPYIRDGVLFVPCTLVAYNRIKGTDTICLHPNLMDDKDVEALDRFIAEHRDEAIAFDEEYLRGISVRYSIFTHLYERYALSVRNLKNMAAHSDRLAAYLEYTNHPNKYVKLLRRVFLLPLVFIRKK